MRTFYLILLVAVTALESGKHISSAKQENLVRSKRRWVLSTFEIEENDPGPFPKLISTMFNDKDHDAGQTYSISGKGVTLEPLGVFKINKSSGAVYALKAVDREEYDLYPIKFDVFSIKTGKKIDDELSFNIEVMDLNDNKPTFSHPHLSASVRENLVEGTLPLTLLATDKDQRGKPQSKITISMLSQNPKEPKIELKQTGTMMAELTFKGCFDYEKAKKYEIIVEAKDHGEPRLSSTSVVTLDILSSNTHLPTFREKEYHGEVMESMTKENVLRITVDDKDTPKTPDWNAKFFFIKGNEQNYYKIETDPNTNEGILSVIKSKDFESTTFTTLQIGVKNEEPLFVCKDYIPASTHPLPNTINVTMKVIDVNDPPVYEKNKFDVHRKEEEEPGIKLFTPKITDVDSDVSKIRHVLVHDPASWVKIDEKTGTITTTKKMDRESSYVDDANIYKIIVNSIDDGEPPATGTCTVLVHLGDINDNTPELVNKGLIMCGNKANKVIVNVTDRDIPPFSGPFTFSLGDDDKTLAQQWKLDPDYGEQSGLICLKTLPYGNYSVPLVIQDQQGSITRDTVEVMVCDCEKGDVCRTTKASSLSFGAPGIGLLFLGLLLFLLLLLLFMCQCGEKKIQMVQDEGNQTLIKYNQEGGGSTSMAEPTLLLTPTDSLAVTDGIKKVSKQMFQMAPVMSQETDTYNFSAPGMMNQNMTSLGSKRTRDTFRSQGGQTMSSSWNANRANTYQSSSWNANRANTYQGGSSTFNRSLSLQSNQNMANHIDRRLYTIDAHHVDHPVYQPYEYAYEGQGSKGQSLDQLSLHNTGDDLIFLNDLGPKFKTLAGICRQTNLEKNIQL
ncbi:cadherin-like protein 26 [Cottoperca gobio]|uniref:Cadherin-like protein 26 n=1 Tax=Cottoperca gobio TaxID=56716 RepID=A0A6J2PZ80_COTGO|nr:cadherin-like protein 26 [Cottoperca gobio]